MAKSSKIEVKGTEITILKDGEHDFISLTDMLKAKHGDFFIADWRRSKNTVEFLGIWESVYNPFRTIAIPLSGGGYRATAFHLVAR